MKRHLRIITVWVSRTSITLAVISNDESKWTDSSSAVAMRCRTILTEVLCKQGLWSAIKSPSDIGVEMALSVRRRSNDRVIIDESIQALTNKLAPGPIDIFYLNTYDVVNHEAITKLIGHYRLK